MSILHINQLAAYVQRELVPHLDVSDLRPPIDGNPAVLSRALAAVAVQALTGCDEARAAARVIDGFGDNGIDAVAVDDAHERLIVVQAKWHAEGRKSIDQAEALKLANGIRALVAGKFDRFNPRLHVFQHEIDEALLNPRVKITLAVATTGPEQLPVQVRQPLDDFCNEINITGDTVDISVLGLRTIHDFVVNGTSGRGADLEVHLTGWGSIHTPYEAFYGVASADQVAAWYEHHGESLFDGNLRDALGQTPVNDGLFATLWNEPDHFWYFNNGITILAQEVRRAVRDSHTREYGRFQVTGATIVNGAQTAASVRSILRKDPNRLNDAQIWVRIISLEGCPDGFAARVTRATNTQNGVDARDFIALDPRQERIRAQFRLQFGKSYGVRRGSETISGDDGCDVEEAAVALACAASDPTFAVDAKRQISSLWASSDDPIYQTLFPDDLNVAYLWNCVLVLRTVEKELTQLRRRLDGREAGVAVHGNRLIAHLVFSQLDDHDLRDHSSISRNAFGENFSAIEDLARVMRDALSEQVRLHHSGAFLASLFKNHDKCRDLTDRVLDRHTSSPAERPHTRPRASHPTPARTSTSGRKTDAVKVIQSAGILPNDTEVIFEAVTEREKRLLLPWISQDPKRGRARWNNDSWDALTWEVDGKKYAASGLVMHMMIQAGFPPPSGVRGPTRWKVPGRGTLTQIADRIAQKDAEA